MSQHLPQLPAHDIVIRKGRSLGTSTDAVASLTRAIVGIRVLTADELVHRCCSDARGERIREATLAHGAHVRQAREDRR